MTEQQYKGFDIETTGLNAPDCEMVSWSIGTVCKIQGMNDNEVDIIQRIKPCLNEQGLLTFMGGTFYGPGFDFPFLRTRCAILGVPWPFGGVPHIDIFPIIQKRFDATILYRPELPDMTVEELKQMMKSRSMVSKAKKKQDYIDTIIGLWEPDQITDYINENCELKVKNVTNLKDMYTLLTGDDPGDMRGDMVPRLWRQWKETHDDTILYDIQTYNRADCKKVEILWEIIQGCCPSRDLIPEIL